MKVGEIQLYDEYSMDGIEDLLDFFDTERTAQTIEDQISTEDFGLEIPTDYYRPYYNKFQTLVVDGENGLTEDIVKTCRHKAKVIALMFIDAILKKYNLQVDEFWIDNLGDDALQGFTIVLYDFFVLHMKEYLFEVITRYIDANASTLAAQFDSNSKTTGGATLSSLLQVLPEDYAIIGANVYDVCYVILTNLNEVEYINYIDSDNEIQPHLKAFFEDARITGNFVDTISTMIGNLSNGLKSYLGFEIISYLKRKYGKDK